MVSPTKTAPKKAGAKNTAPRRNTRSNRDERKNLTEWKEWLASNGPILAALNVDSSWDDAASNGGKVDTFHPGTVRGGHAICVVGYRTDGRFIVRNSWGTAGGTRASATSILTTSSPRSTTSPTASHCDHNHRPNDACGAAQPWTDQGRSAAARRLDGAAAHELPGQPYRSGPNPVASAFQPVRPAGRSQWLRR